MFPAIRKNIGPNLKALICGSAPLAVETQLFYMMLGIPVLQVYGLTETTAICTMDDPAHVEPGRVGPAVPGIEMTMAENGEILVRGPNVFPGYWQRPAETAKALEGGWFHTGDQGEVDAKRQLAHHRTAEESDHFQFGAQCRARAARAGARGALAGGAAGGAAREPAELSGGARDDGGEATARRTDWTKARRSALDSVNAGLPHYKQIRAFHVVPRAVQHREWLADRQWASSSATRSPRGSRREIEQLYQKKPA